MAWRHLPRPPRVAPCASVMAGEELTCLHWHTVPVQVRTQAGHPAKTLHSDILCLCFTWCRLQRQKSMPLACRLQYFEAQFYKRETGAATSIGVFRFAQDDPQDQDAAAAKAAHAADRALFKYYEDLGRSTEYIASRLNVRCWAMVPGACVGVHVDVCNTGCNCGSPPVKPQDRACAWSLLAVACCLLPAACCDADC